MKVYEIFENITVQGKYKIVYYDYEKMKLVEVKELANYTEKDINYLYVKDNVLYIEINNEN